MSDFLGLVTKKKLFSQARRHGYLEMMEVYDFDQLNIFEECHGDHSLAQNEVAKGIKINSSLTESCLDLDVKSFERSRALDLLTKSTLKSSDRNSKLWMNLSSN